MNRAENKCPVCGKAGIPDYKKEDVTCPACNTDLSIYRIIATNDSNHKGWQILAGILVLIIASLFFFRPSKQPALGRERALQDSINVMQTQVNSLTSQMDSLKDLNNGGTEALVYVVNHGDSFSKISRKLLGTEKYAPKIASFNGLSLKDAIHPKMRLKIPQND